MDDNNESVENTDTTVGEGVAIAVAGAAVSFIASHYAKKAVAALFTYRKLRATVEDNTEDE